MLMTVPPSEPMSIEPCSYILLFHNHARRHLGIAVVSQSNSKNSGGQSIQEL